MTESPHLETERLRLRWLTLDDAPLLLDVWNNPDFIHYVGDRGIRTLDQARDAMEQGILATYRDHAYGPFRIELKSGEPVGISGLFKREHMPFPDIGFALLQDYYGRGLAQEASIAVLDWCCSRNDLATILAIVSPDNGASITLIERLGFTFQDKQQFGDDPVLVYRKELGNR